MYESASMTGHSLIGGYMSDAPEHSFGEEPEVPAVGYQQLGRSELLGRVQLLESKLELSRTIGHKLLAQEEQYQTEIEGLQDKLWQMEEQLTSLRLHNSSLMEELFNAKQDNIDLSTRLSEAGDLQQWLSDQQSDQSWQQSAMQELQVQVNKLKIQNSDLQDQLTEMKIEAEARERIDSAFKDRAATGPQARRRPPSAALSISRLSVADDPRALLEQSEAEGEEEPAEFSFEDHNQLSAAYLTQVLDLEAQVEELTTQLERQSNLMEEMKADLTYYRSIVPLRGRPISASFDGADHTVSLAHELEALTGSTSPVKRLDDTREEIQSSELDDIMKDGGDDEGIKRPAHAAADMHADSHNDRSSLFPNLEPSGLRHRRKPCSDLSGIKLHSLVDSLTEISELRNALAESRQAEETLTRDYNRLQLLTALLLVCTLFIFVAVQGLMYIATHDTAH